MQAVLAKDLTGHNPEFDARQRPSKANPPVIDQPEGTVIDHADAYLLVQCGIARPHDEECREKAGLTSEEIEDRILRHNNLEQGIGLDMEFEEDDDDNWPIDEDEWEVGCTDIFF